MSYQSQADLYNDAVQRQRMEMCCREQAYIFATDPNYGNAALARGVVGGLAPDIDALIAGAIVGPNGAALADDANLLAAIQSIWPTVAVARYGPQT